MTIFPVSISANWHAASQASGLTDRKRDWLLEPHSLTAKLKAHATDFAVHVLSEQRCKLSSQQQFMLQAKSEYALIREVLLLCDGVPHVYAQSWLPDGDNNRLHNMGNRPLGDVIFQNPDLTRDPIEVAQFDLQHELQLLIEQLNEPKQALLARRSVFSLHDYRFLVCEVFLPGAHLYS